MAMVLLARKQGSSIHVCLKGEICRKLNIKHGDTVIVELVEVEKDAISKTFTAHYGDEIVANALLLKKDGIKLQF